MSRFLLPLMAATTLITAPALAHLGPPMQPDLTFPEPLPQPSPQPDVSTQGSGAPNWK
ncbi:hypothetical protein [Mameliella sediminis]|uniref:hypothetical protein n=1 Tax=Mameliella sediminis TaxID=2836866 RepID=UPI001C443A64|nr:hypothetical protein [Mameliella sediminis]MBV7395533.1 hypothetical protein [Mameliella sediminis]